MIALNKVSEHFEKNAGAIGRVLKAIYRHPVGALGVVGAGALGAGALNYALNAANKSSGLYNVYNEERKRKTMLEQQAIMNQIAESLKKPEAATVDPRTIPYSEPGLY